MGQHQLLQVGELADGEIRPLEIDGRSLLLVNGENGPALIDRICPHAGGDLAKGLRRSAGAERRSCRRKKPGLAGLEPGPTAREYLLPGLCGVATRSSGRLADHRRRSADTPCR